jgi:hypothetical protein
MLGRVIIDRGGVHVKPLLKEAGKVDPRGKTYGEARRVRDYRKRGIRVTKRLSRRSIVLLAVLAVCLVAGTALAAGVNGVFSGLNVVRVKLDGKEITADVPAVILEGRTMVPLRLISENLGLNVAWNATTYTVDLSSKTAPTTGGTREGFIVSDKNVGFAIAGANAKQTLLGYSAPVGYNYLQFIIVVKNFSDDAIWISPETFFVMADGKKWDYDSTVTFMSQSRLSPKAVNRNEYASGMLVFQVPDKGPYTLSLGTLLYTSQMPNIPIIVNNP